MIAAINFINQSSTLKDIASMPTYRLHPLKGDKNNVYAMDLGKKIGFRLLLKPDPPIAESDESLDFTSKCSKVTKVIIMEVSNHYE